METSKRIFFIDDAGQQREMIPILNNAIHPETGEWFPLISVQDALPEGFRLVTVQEIAEKDVPPLVTYEPTGIFETEDEAGEPYLPGEAPEILKKIISKRPYKILEI